MTVALYSVLWLLAQTLAVASHLTPGVCHSIDIRNKAERLDALRGCRVVEGHVRILLMERSKEADFDNHSLPELREITEYLMFYRVVGLRNVGQIFPNLTLIRGDELFEDYALIIYEMFSLEEIGLASLAQITRGAVRIEKSPNLCHVQTVAWDRIARWDPDRNYLASNKDPADCPACDKCPQGRCWSRDQCQNLNKTNPACDPLCVGGCSGPGPRRCFTCNKFITNDNECVDNCPSGTYQFLKRRCITEAECLNMSLPNSKVKFVTFNHTCTDLCPEGKGALDTAKSCVQIENGKYIKRCAGCNVKNMVTAQSLRGCTFIDGSLEINIKLGKPKTVARELEENLGSITEIKGGLKVFRSPPIVNLHFLKNLTTIHGTDGKTFALNIMENQNLQELWDWDTKQNFKILNNRLFIHYNPKLCMHHILKLIDIAGMKNVTNLEVSKDSNGDKFSCDAQAINISVSYKTFNLIQIHIPFVEVLRFEIHFMKNPGSNVSMYYDLDQCSEYGWKTIDVSVNTQSEQYKTQGLNVNLTDLEPYMQYAFYVSGYSVNKIVATSSIHNEGTLPSTPSELVSVQVYSNSSSEIVVSWKPPLKSNGKLEKYEITWKLLDNDESLLSLRNYCEHPMTYEPEPVTFIPVIQEKFTNSTYCCNKPLLLTQKDGFEQLCTTFSMNTLPIGFPKPEPGQTCKSYFNNYIYNNAFTFDKCDETPIKNQDMKEVSNKVFKGKTLITNKISNFGKVQPKENVEHLRANTNNFTIRYVEHFKDYIVTVKACREQYPEESDLTDIHRCSKTEIVVIRTQKDMNADLISDRIEHEVLNNTLYVSWDVPLKPNGLVLAFELEYRQRGVVNPKSITYCIPFPEYLLNEKSYSVLNLQPGDYEFRIRTISQAGKGPYSQFISFSVSRPFSQIDLVSTIVIIIIVVALMVLLIVFCKSYQKRPKFDAFGDIYSLNVFYNQPLDQWELQRDDIIFGREVGFGTFGKVYEGLLRPNNVPCAIKTVSEYANLYERNTFLTEASIMKSVSGSYHIVQLMGVVTREKPPLVVMELMDLGDLRSYLISLRGTNTITEEKMLRISAQIADGMCFMEAKKFVHRDLAARNCLINKDLTVKVGDFGMTRDIYENDYYRKGGKGLLPIRWMAPESLKDGLFTSQSDVWSYGVVLWEIVTLGEQPYQGMSNEKVLRDVLGGSLKLEIPQDCPDPLKILMRSCWRNRPTERISFIHTVGSLEYYIDDEFKKVSYFHSEEASVIRELLTDYIDVWSADDPLLSEITNHNLDKELVDLLTEPSPHRSSLDLGGFGNSGSSEEETEFN